MAADIKDKTENQKRFDITFRKNIEEMELYNWAKQKGKIGGISNYVKTMLYNEMLKEKEGK